MLASKLVFKTQRELPQDAEALSHRLLLKGGYIRRLASGIYSVLPLGYRVLKRVSAIIEEEFDGVGANELLLPALHPLEIWQATGRDQKMKDVLFQVESKVGRFVLGPTHEEAVIEAVAPDLASYRDLPAIVYQLQTKFRDEPRARFGLMRTREFIMADAYSFDTDRQGMRESYDKMFSAYVNIFSSLGLDAQPVVADAGSIGGDVNHEFMVASAIGEDFFVSCPRCGYKANIEAAEIGIINEEAVDVPAAQVFSTPDAPGVEVALEALAAKDAPVTATSMLKCMVAVDEKGDFTIFALPGERQLVLPSGYRLATDEELSGSKLFAKGYVGPVGWREKGVKLVGDPLIKRRKWWASGNNVAGEHVVGLMLGRDFEVDEWRRLVEIKEGDPCPRCQSGVSLIRSVEVGHTFQLGLAYSSILEKAGFTDSDGVRKPYWMGCYGIGVTRLLAVIAEQYLDADNLTLAWPTRVAPFQVSVIPAGKDSRIEEMASRIYEQLLALGYRVLLDDRQVSFGVKMGDLDLIGSPVAVIVGRNAVENGQAELRDRLNGVEASATLEECATSVSELLDRAGSILR
jgi:prolyl-tRNA synthetase